MMLPRIANRAFAVTLAIVSVMAFSEASDLTPGVVGNMTYSSIDYNRDGVVDREELATYPSRHRGVAALGAHSNDNVTDAKHAPLYASTTRHP
ncbi:hypothetical protein SAMN05216289_12732 [Dokdonella immobilis]|uniref:EF hand n=2 Tax=Dokdonella immobilis TaxID=578942 RepID=A0A1I4ZN02_9GAMM|nr:hypothetical protein SAMN05216289_12732 [Dokdonella immobilis]